MTRCHQIKHVFLTTAVFIIHINCGSAARDEEGKTRAQQQQLSLRHGTNLALVAPCCIQVLTGGASDARPQFVTRFDAKLLVASSLRSWSKSDAVQSLQYTVE